MAYEKRMINVVRISKIKASKSNNDNINYCNVLNIDAAMKLSRKPQPVSKKNL